MKANDAFMIPNWNDGQKQEQPMSVANVLRYSKQAYHVLYSNI